MKKSIKPQNQTLETLVTGDAKRQAESLGIPLAAFIGNLAAKADTLPVTIRVGMGDIGRINSLIGGGRIHEWIENIIPEVLDGEKSDREIQVPVELPDDLHEWVNDRATTLKTSPEELVREALVLAKKRAEKAAKN